jgi:hypothetical protein
VRASAPAVLPPQPKSKPRLSTEDEDDEPRRSSRKAKSSRIDDEDDYDDRDDDFERRPRRSRKRRKSGNTGLLVGLLVGGGLLLLIGVGLVLFFALRGGGTTQNQLIGKWQSTNAPVIATIEFMRDGTLIQDIGIIKLNQKYRVINDNTMEIETINPFAGALKGAFKGFPNQPGMPNLKIDLNAPVIREQVGITVTRDELVIVDPVGRKTYKRIQ